MKKVGHGMFETFAIHVVCTVFYHSLTNQVDNQTDEIAECMCTLHSYQ